jgi:hypothetical protein
MNCPSAIHRRLWLNARIGGSLQRDASMGQPGESPYQRYTGSPEGGDVFDVKRTLEQTEFSQPLRVKGDRAVLSQALFGEQRWQLERSEECMWFGMVWERESPPAFLRRQKSGALALYPLERRTNRVRT